MPKVTFPKGWRGHAKGAVIEVTDEELAVLGEYGDCDFTVEGAAQVAQPEPPKPAPTAKPAKASKKEDRYVIFHSARCTNKPTAMLSPIWPSQRRSVFVR